MKSKSILRKALSVFTAMAMSFSFMTFSAVGVNAVEVGEVVNSGSCGESATWTLTKNGVDGESNDTYALTISGTGAITTAPWYTDYRLRITDIVIEDGITSIDNGAFVGCDAFTEITIPSTVETIGNNAFLGCDIL
ncbi:MAG: leucine-rich repeat protein, partial [Oscillospiraceae bacterium]|nr:leucine-rich repeat protein [Oscillospiraceae bacterium]